MLRDLGWQTHCRGEIFVKGKNNMVTYFVDPMTAPEITPRESYGGASSGGRDSRTLRTPSSDRGKHTLISIKAMLDRNKTFNVNAEIRRSSLPPEVLASRRPSNINNNALNWRLSKIQESIGDPTVTKEDATSMSSQTKSVKFVEGTQESLDSVALESYDKVKHNISEKTKSTYYELLDKFHEEEEENYYKEREEQESGGIRTGNALNTLSSRQNSHTSINTLNSGINRNNSSMDSTILNIEINNNSNRTNNNIRSTLTHSKDLLIDINNTEIS